MNQLRTINGMLRTLLSAALRGACSEDIIYFVIYTIWKKTSKYALLTQRLAFYFLSENKLVQKQKKVFQQQEWSIIMCLI